MGVHGHVVPQNMFKILFTLWLFLSTESSFRLAYLHYELLLATVVDYIQFVFILVMVIVNHYIAFQYFATVYYAFPEVCGFSLWVSLFSGLHYQNKASVAVLYKLPYFERPYFPFLGFCLVVERFSGIFFRILKNTHFRKTHQDGWFCIFWMLKWNELISLY